MSSTITLSRSNSAGHRFLIASVLAASVCTGCGGGQETVARHGFRVIDEDGVPTAVSYGPPRFEGDLFRYEPLITLRQIEEVPDSFIRNPVTILRDSMGRYQVFDQTDGRILVFGSDGHYLFAHGRKGEGPAEFPAATRLVGIHEGRIHLWNPSRRRYIVWSQDGGLVEAITSPPSVEHATGAWYDADADRVIMMNYHMVRSDSARTEVRVTDRQGTVLWSLKSPPVRTQMTMSVPDRPRPYGFGLPFAPKPAGIYVHGRGILVSGGAEPLLEWYDLERRLTGRVRIDALDLVPGEWERAVFEERWGLIFESARDEDGVKARRMVKQALPVPERLNPWSYIHVDDRGFYWLRVNEEVDEYTVPLHGYRYRILSPQGEYLGMTRTPKTHRVEDYQQHMLPLSISGGCYMTIVDDADTGAKVMQVYRMVAAVMGFEYPSPDH